MAASGSATVTLVVRPTAAAGEAGFVDNTATADGSNTTPAADTERTTVEESDITIEKDDFPDPADVGESLLYRLRVTNNNTGSSRDIDIVDRLPDGVEFISVDESQGTCTESSNVVRCQINNLAPSTTATIRIFVEPLEEGTIENTARAFARNDPFTPIARATEETEVEGGTDNSDDNGEDDNGDDDNGEDDNGDDDNGDDDNNDEDDFVDEITVDEVVDSATDDEGGVLAESGVDPDEQAPVSEPQGEVQDEIATEGPLPNTGGMSILAVVLPIAGFLVLCLSIIHRSNRNR
jgi:uncharacterized repeat protein (TIGR01451 family)